MSSVLHCVAVYCIVLKSFVDDSVIHVDDS